MSDRDSANSQNAGLGSRNITSEASVDVEREPTPEEAPETGSNIPKVPPARSGSAAEATEKPTEGDQNDNPAHHTGHIPPPVTSNHN